MQWGTATSDYTGAAPDSTSVVIGKGQVNWPELLKVTMQQGIQHYYIEDEAEDAVKQVAQSLSYLKSLQ